MTKVIIDDGDSQTVEVIDTEGNTVEVTSASQTVEVGSPVTNTVAVQPAQQSVDIGGVQKTTVEVQGTSQKITVITGFGANITDHTQLTSIGTNTHVEIDSHLGDTFRHFGDTGVDGILYLRSDNSWITLPKYFSEVHNDLTGRDVPDVHPASSISIDPIGGIDNVADLLVLLDEQIGLRETAATGVISGGLVNPNPGIPTTSIDIATGSGEIVDGYTDRRAPVRTNINWLAVTIDLTPHFLQDTGVINVHVAVNVPDPDDSTVVIGQGALSESARRTQVQLALVFYRNGVIDDIVHAPILSNEVGNTLYDLIAFIPPEERVVGLDVQPIAGAMSIYMLAGQIFAAGANVDFGNPTTINIKDLPMIGNNVTPALFDIIFEDGTVQAAAQTVIPEYYESAPGITSNLIANQAAIHYVYRTIGGKLLLQLGQVAYQNGKVARDSIPADRTTYGKFTGNASTLFSAQIYMQRNTSDFTDETLAGIVDNLGSGGTSAGPGGSVTEFLALTDVNEVTYAGQARRMVSVNDVTLGNGDALEFTDEPVRWRGKWLSATYRTNDMAKDGDWTGIANKDTTTRLAPQPIGNPLFTLPEPAPWEGDAFGSDVSVVECIHDYTMTKKGWIQVLRVWSPAGSANPDYTSRIYTYDITDPTTPILLNQINNPTLAENAWTTVDTGNKIVQVGQVLRVVFQQFISSEGVSITGGWALGTFNSGSAPVTGNWNSNNNVTGNATLVRIDKTDLDGTNRETELSGIVEGSTIRFVQTDDPTKSADFTVATPTSVVDNGTYFTITIDTGTTEGSGGRPDNGAVTTMDTFVPVAVPTEYVTENNYWFGNNPPFANVKAELRYDGVPILGIGFPETAYGIDIEFQEASVSDDWDLVALSGGSSSSGGGTGGSEFFADLLDTPADFVGAGDQLVAVKTDMTGLEYIDPQVIPPQTFLHNDLTDVAPDQHHNKSHAHDGADGSGTVDYNNLTNLPVLGGGVHRGATPPVDKVATPIWFNTVTGKTFTWYEDGDSNQWVQDVPVDGTGLVPTPVIYPQKNYIINPTFSVNQRGFAGGAVTSGNYNYDRWTNSNGNVSLVDANGFITISGFLDDTGVQHRIEDFGYVGAVTVSWEGTSQLQVYDANGGSFTTPVNSPLTFNMVEAGNTIADVAEFLQFTNGTFKNAKLEIGSVATPFEYPDIGTELDKCQRYYERQIGNGGVNIASGYAQSTTEARTYFKYNAPKRITNPTINAVGLRVTSRAWGNTAMDGFTYISGRDSARLFVTVASGLTAEDPLVIDFANTNSYIEISAEL